jgi:hypothetical protein
MKYMLLIHAPAGGAPDPEMVNRHQAFAEAAGRRGKLVDGAELADVALATTLRRNNGQNMVTDGPHAETKEHLAGYYVVDCNDLDEAIEVASTVPIVEGGSLEIRPLVEH